MLTDFAAKLHTFPQPVNQPVAGPDGYPSFGMPRADGNLQWQLRAEWLDVTLRVVSKGQQERYFQQHAFALCQSWFLLLMKQTSDRLVADALPTYVPHYYTLFGMCVPAMSVAFSA